MDTNTLIPLVTEMIPLPEQRLVAEESHLPRPELEVAVLVVHLWTLIP
jgi:hypothetical protein